jgi:hypothetical protein
VTRRSIPPVSDRLSLALRAYAGPTFTELKNSDGGDKEKDKSSTLPVPEKSTWTLVFDTETTTDPGQALRFGTYQLFDADALVETGIFYDPEADPDDNDTVRRYADRQKIELHTRQSFVDEIFFGRAYRWRATIVGINLPFDISRLAIGHGTARNPIEAERRSMDDAFTFKAKHRLNRTRGSCRRQSGEAISSTLGRSPTPFLRGASDLATLPTS